MSGFGLVDFVIADVVDNGTRIKNFVSVELQAVDITGSVEPAYNAVLNTVGIMDKRPSYGINWANVRKRYVNQLITKGFFHHHWGTRIISVIQKPLYDYLRQSIQFDQLPPDGNANIIFMLYDFEDAADESVGRHELRLCDVIGTSHSSLLTSALYRPAPPKQQFCDKILERLNGN